MAQAYRIIRNLEALKEWAEVNPLENVLVVFLDIIDKTDQRFVDFMEQHNFVIVKPSNIVENLYPKNDDDVQPRAVFAKLVSAGFNLVERYRMVLYVGDFDTLLPRDWIQLQGRFNRGAPEPSRLHRKGDQPVKEVTMESEVEEVAEDVIRLTPFIRLVDRGIDWNEKHWHKGYIFRGTAMPEHDQVEEEPRSNRNFRIHVLSQCEEITEEIRPTHFRNLRDAAIVYGVENLRVFHHARRVHSLHGLGLPLGMTSSDDPMHVVEAKIVERFNRRVIEDDFKVVLESLDPAFGNSDYYISDFENYLRDKRFVDSHYVMVGDVRLTIDWCEYPEEEAAKD